MNIHKFNIQQKCCLRLSLQSASEDVQDVNNVESSSTAPSLGRQVNVSFNDERLGMTVNYAPVDNPEMVAQYMPTTDLETFLARPVLIQTLTWNLSTLLNGQFNPWDLFFNDTIIKKKLDNYSLINCNLKLKIMVNASPFWYGLGMFSYQPLQNWSPLYATPSPEYVAFSQMPHIWVYPQTSQGGEMTLPFFYYKNWLRVNSRTEFQDMGRIYYRSPVSLLNANGIASGGVTIQIYAWAENVKVAGPTVALALQSGSDEYGTGPVSKPASALATFAKKFKVVPIPFISQFATATTLFASGVSKFATLFGYTNVPVIDDVKPLKNLPFHAMASSEIGQPVDKLTIDPKCELTIDNRVVGLDGADEMAISHFVMRESILATYSWATTAIPGDLICAARVQPWFAYSSTFGANTQVTSLPISYASALFSFWRGDIIFRFRFICSQFHRGRARITWDPEGNIIANSTTSTSSFTRIVDISTETDIEVRVPYMQAAPWSSIDRTFGSPDDTYGDSTYVNSRVPNVDNGTITVRVFTANSAPVVSASVIVVVSVRAADNFEFSVPKELDDRLSPYFVQSGQECFTLEEKNQEELLGTEVSPVPHRYLENMGESYLSFRQLLRRAVYVRSVKPSADGSSLYAVTQQTFPRFPPYNGYDPLGFDTANGLNSPALTFPYNWVKNVPFNFLALSYVGMRGSSVWHFNVDSNSSVKHLRVSRFFNTSTAGDYRVSLGLATGSTSNQASRFFSLQLPSGYTGQSLTNQLTQTGQVVYAPFYSKYKMQTTDPNTRTVGTSRDDSNTDKLRMETLNKPSTVPNNDSVNTVHLYHNIGTDFSFIFFRCVPTLLLYNATPNSS